MFSITPRSLAKLGQSDNPCAIGHCTNRRSFVSLTARPATIEDAALLVLLGQRVSRGNDAVTGGEIIGGLGS